MQATTTDAARAILAEIKRDIADYPTLRAVRSFADLHDVVDANEYLADIIVAIGEPDWSDQTCPRVRYVNEVTAKVDRLLRLGALAHPVIG